MIRRLFNARFDSSLVWAIGTAGVSFLIFLSTLQGEVNGSHSPYATDVGEIQNALPRWGTIHPNGYPLYTLTGSMFVTILRSVGVQPAAGASLYSAIWGAVAAGLLVLIARQMEVPGPVAALSSLVVMLSTSIWIDASLAEVHTMTMVFTLGTILMALRFGRSGTRRDLLGLTLIFTQGVAHQPPAILLALPVGVLIWPKIGAIRDSLWPVLGIAMLAPLTYLYLPVRAWQGATWTFGQPGTWQGFWATILETKTGCCVMGVPKEPSQWLTNTEVRLHVLNEDLPIWLVAMGLAGLLLPALRGHRRESLGLALAGLLYLPLYLIIWEGRVSDAMLAVKLPVVGMAGLGLALIASEIGRRWSRLRIGMIAILAVVCGVLFVSHRPAVLAITRDPSAEPVIARVDQLALPVDRPITFMALWGHDFWALTYAQAYRDQIQGLNLVDHNADFRDILKRGDRLLTLDQTLHERPLKWWDDRVKRVYLTSIAPGIIEIAKAPPLTPADVPEGPQLDLGNGIQVLSAQLNRLPNSEQLALTVYWEAVHSPEEDYHVAVHLLAQEPPQAPSDILVQADQQHPVNGWYPTSRWKAGEIVRDDYVIAGPAGTEPVAVRVGMYLIDPQGGFTNTQWLVLRVPVTATMQFPPGQPSPTDFQRTSHHPIAA